MVAEVVFIPAPNPEVMAAVPVNPTYPKTSQSPAVKSNCATFFEVLDVSDVALPLLRDAEAHSPTLPAAALLFVVVPIISEVELKDKLVAEAAPRVGVVNVILVAAIPGGNVELILGTPPALVTNTPLFAVASPAIVFAALEYKS